MRLILGTRGSTLAQGQSTLIADALRALGHEVELEIIVTRGDREQHKPVPQLGGKGLFTAELEEALRDRRIDLAVHSLKDLPTEEEAGLIIGCIPEREDPRDALVAATSLAQLEAGARVGTASLRRRAQLRRARPDLSVVDLRGNVDTRIKKVTDGELEGVVLAAAGLHRIGRADVIREYLDFLPAPAQGALALQTHAERTDVHAALAPLHHEGTAACTTAEREMLRVLEGGCSVPVGALARRFDDGLQLYGMVAAPDGSEFLRAHAEGDDPIALGRAVAAELLDLGAKEILDA